MRKIVTAAAAAALALPAAAQAHVTASPPTLPAEGYGKVDLSVPHGCEESPTTRVTVQMPDEVQSATPQVVPGWKLSTKEGKLAKPYESDGEQVTEGVREITWSGGPLDAHQLEVFGLSVKVAGNVGAKVPFKVVQKCAKGAHNWVEIPVEGEEEPPEPAPMVELVAAEEEVADAETERVAVQNAGAPSDSDDGGGASTGLTIAALIVGALGLAAGTASLVTARRRPTG
jgi:periplasmic copper chaperone A